MIYLDRNVIMSYQNLMYVTWNLSIFQTFLFYGFFFFFFLLFFFLIWSYFKIYVKMLFMPKLNNVIISYNIIAETAAKLIVVCNHLVLLSCLYLSTPPQLCLCCYIILPPVQLIYVRKMPSHSFHLTESISFIFITFGYTHVTLSFSLTFTKD